MADFTRSEEDLHQCKLFRFHSRFNATVKKNCEIYKKFLKISKSHHWIRQFTASGFDLPDSHRNERHVEFYNDVLKSLVESDSRLNAQKLSSKLGLAWLNTQRHLHGIDKNMNGSNNHFNLQNRTSIPNIIKNTENLYTINTTTNIADFYKNAYIFVTGGTGFLGKALIEKLLRSYEGLNTIYIMIRPKRGLNTEQRLKELINSTVFDRIREKCPEYFDKLKVISGDVAQVNLGLNDTDKNLLLSNVNIVFHSAATVKFNENLKDAIILNTLGTQRIVEFCRKMTKLQSFVHVSTAYSNCDKQEIKEIVYPPPHDPASLIQCIEALPDDVITDITEKIQGKHPNTYTLTKAMAEYVVESANDLPAAIVRPSIVTAAWKEPFPGWVDNISGITGIMMEIGRGTIRSIVCEESLTIDLIPIDIVVNTLIAVAWHTNFNRSNTLRVYNCTSGQLNGIQWNKLGNLTQKYSIINPSKYVMLYPGFKFRTNRIMHKFYEVFLHVIPAIFFDLLLRAQGAKPIMLKICNKFKSAAKNGEFFALHEFLFQNNNMKSLICDIKTHTTDFENLECDITNGFEWEPYIESYMLGIRKYVLKDNQDSLTDARKRYIDYTGVIKYYNSLPYIFL